MMHDILLAFLLAALVVSGLGLGWTIHADTAQEKRDSEARLRLGYAKLRKDAQESDLPKKPKAIKKYRGKS